MLTQKDNIYHRGIMYGPSYINWVRIRILFERALDDPFRFGKNRIYLNHFDDAKNKRFNVEN